MATQPRIVNKQFNSPINLYSQQNVKEVLDRESQLLANGAVGIDFINQSMTAPGQLKNSAVLRMLQEEENRQRNGYGPGNDMAKPLRENITWPPPEYEHKNHLRSTFKDVVTPGAKRVAWPPPNETGLEGPYPEQINQTQGGPQYQTQPPSGFQQNNYQATPAQTPSRTPLKSLDITQHAGASPLASPITNQSPQAFKPATPNRGWAPVHSPVGSPSQPSWQTTGTHYETAHQPVSQQTFLGQQYQGTTQPYQTSESQQQSRSYQQQQTQKTVTQYQTTSQQYQPGSPNPPQYQTSSQQYQTTQQVQSQPQYQAPPNQYQTPSQQYQAPPQQYQGQPQQYQGQPQQFQGAPQQYQGQPQQYQGQPQQYQGAPQQYQGQPQQYQGQPQQFQGAPQQYQGQPQQYQGQPQQYQGQPQQYQAQSQQYQTSPQQPSQFSPQPAAPKTQVQPVKQNKSVEPPPSTITLRPKAPVSQTPAPVISSQPATATLRVNVSPKNLRGDQKWPPEEVKIKMLEEATNADTHLSFLSLEGGKHLRGDLKWPPENVKYRMAEEQRLILELAQGPACRPGRPNKDYTEFFDSHALNSTYPGYKIPPGTQFYRPID